MSAFDAVAYHEAGHAVAAVALGVPVIEAVVVDMRDGPPYVRLPELEVWSRSRAAIEARIVIAFAGSAAMARKTKRGVAFELIRGGRNDVALINELLAEAQVAGWGNAREYDQERYCYDARKLVCRHWPAIERVARALMEHGRINGATVVALVDRAGHDLPRRETLATCGRAAVQEQ